MNEEIYNWKNKEHIAQYLEQARLDLLEDNQASLVVKEVSLADNYGFILLAADQLNIADKEFLKQYIVGQLKEYGYKINRENKEEIIMQASVRERIKGNQLFGTTKIIDKGYELRILVSPYKDRSYAKVLDKKELIDLLFI